MYKLLTLFLCIIIFSAAIGQPNISITIDDVPNTVKYKNDNFKSKLLKKLDSLNIPIAIFINEGKIYKEHPNENSELLNQWTKRKYITLGNHTFSHARFSEITADSLEIEIHKGDSLTKSFSKQYNKPLNHFRFPYNDLGKDSVQQWQGDSLLKLNGYTITPFTVESSDWVFNYLYEHYLKSGDRKEADKIADAYISMTLQQFAFLDSLSNERYGRIINHIYLCHDNTINADYLDILIQKLKERNYSFISLDSALQDSVYSQRNFYHKKWGISWFYRWIPDNQERTRLVKSEPDMKEIYERYNEITARNKK